LAARGSKLAGLFKRSSGAPDPAALSQHLDKLNQLEVQQGGKDGAGGQGGGAEGEGDGDEPVDVVHDEDDDDVMEEDDYYQVITNLPCPTKPWFWDTQTLIVQASLGCLLSAQACCGQQHALSAMVQHINSAAHADCCRVAVLRTWCACICWYCCYQGEYFDDDEGYDDLGEDGNDDGPVY
jgi:hypothetical protein